ncbi:ech hydrogenase subunit B [Fervidicella metallireducens AeB]|uniref:Ech hydrogenase subunit B n=1 Tax=Fervidicella metallireducens AeB TaxID=1403537 RepID=A0A017RYZ4_9CLOT|nr:complex I subunit 1 family protein [Fervidicella metallireducens]EYE89145.1 ech hydrogenase subunit B [Fervidicella metallireducens AeB]
MITLINLKILIKLLLILILPPVIGCILSGIDRKVTAHLQGRVGPPLLQPLYDVIKLFNKENIVVNKYQNVYVITYFIFVVLSLFMLLMKMDFLMIIFVYTIANTSLIVGGMSTGSPYSRIGSVRETISMLAYEPILLFYIIGMYMLTGSFKISKLAYTNKPLLYYLPLIFIAMLFIMTIKFKKSPFDFSTSHHAHQELVKGMFTEYSGPALAIIEVAHWYEYVFLLGLIFLFWYTSPIIGLILALITFFLEIVIDNICARLSWEWMLKFTWTIIIGLSIANILFIYLYNVKIL